MPRELDNSVLPHRDHNLQMVTTSLRAITAAGPFPPLSLSAGTKGKTQRQGSFLSPVSTSLEEVVSIGEQAVEGFGGFFPAWNSNKTISFFHL